MTSSSSLRYNLTQDSIEEIKDQLLLQNAELMNTNQNYKEQISNLKSQFETACSATSELEKISEINAKLQNENRLLKGENDDLLQRNEILNQTNSELKKKLSVINLSTNRIQFSEITDLQKKIEKERIDANSQISNLKNQIQKLNECNETSSLKIEKLNLSLKKIYEAFSQKYSINVSDPETVVAVLLTNPIKEKEEVQIKPLNLMSSMTQTYLEDDKSKKKEIITQQNKMKSKIKKLENLTNSLQIDKDASIKEITKKYENLISDLNSTIEQLKGEIERRNERIESISQEKKELIQENGKLTAQVEFSNNQTLFQQQLNKTKHVSFDSSFASEADNEINQLKLSNEKLKKQISAAITKIKFLEDDKNRLKFQAKTQKQTIVEITADLDRISNEKKEMAENIIELEKKLSVALQKHRTAALTAQQQTENLGQKTIDFEKVKIALTKNQTQISKQMEEIQESQEERKKVVSLLYKVSLLLGQYERYEQENRQQEEFKKKMKLSASSNLNANSNSQCSNLNDFVIPAGAFACTEFPEELADLVNSLAMKNSLRNIAKIKQILLVIVQYYNEKMNELKHLMDKERESNMKTNANFKNLTEFLIDLFPQLDLDFENGFKRTLKTYIESIQKVNNDFEKYKNSLNELEQNLMNQNAQFQQQQQKVSLYNSYCIRDSNDNTNISESTTNISDSTTTTFIDENERKARLDLLRILDCDTLNEVRKKVVEIRAKLEKYVNKFKSEKQKRKQALKDSAEKESKLKEQLETLKSSLNEFEQSASSLEIQNQGEKAALNSHIEKVRIENEKLREELSRHQALKNQYQTEMTEKFKRIQFIETQLVTKSNDLKNACRAVELLQQQVKKKDMEINDLRSKIKIAMRQNSEKVKNERELMQNRFDQIVEPLKLKNSEFESAVNDLNDTITSLESDNMKLRKEVSEKTIENEKLAMLADSLKNEADHEKQLIQLKSKTALTALEAECRSKIDEYKWKIEQSKKDVMGLVGMQFCSLYNLNEKIDENNFENFLKEIRGMLEKLVVQDSHLRQLLSLGPNQSVEDAVSKLLLESKPII